MFRASGVERVGCRSLKVDEFRVYDFGGFRVWEVGV